MESTENVPYSFFTGLAIINEHSGLEGSGIDESGLDDIDDLHPKYLPRKEMLTLLVDLLIFNSSQSAVTALIAVCKSASEKPGLTKATDSELEVLFNAMKNEVQCVRGLYFLYCLVEVPPSQVHPRCPNAHNCLS